jgi:hypothetical protein
MLQRFQQKQEQMGVTAQYSSNFRRDSARTTAGWSSEYSYWAMFSDFVDISARTTSEWSKTQLLEQMLQRFHSRNYSRTDGASANTALISAETSARTTQMVSWIQLWTEVASDFSRDMAKNCRWCWALQLLGRQLRREQQKSYSKMNGDAANAALISAGHRLEQLQMVFRAHSQWNKCFSYFSRETSARTTADGLQEHSY